MPLTDEERFALNMLLREQDASSVAVRKQLGNSVVTDRKATGVGFFTTIHLVSSIPIELQRQWDWNFKHCHLSHGGSFMCWLADPNTLELEAVSHNGEWPKIFSMNDFKEN